MKEAAPEYGISKNAITTLNEMLIDSYSDILTEARQMMLYSKKQTLTSKECESAVKLLIPGELGKNAINEGRKALGKFSGQIE